MCFDYEKESLTRRTFLTNATTAVAGVALGSKSSAGQQAGQRALDDPNIIHGEVTFKSGTDTIKGYLSRPKSKRRRYGIIVIHGNPGLPEWVRNFTARLAQIDYAGLVIDINSRVVPDSTKLDKPLDYYISNTFDKQVAQDSLAAIEYMKAQPFARRNGVGMVGFCGGGRKALLLSTQSKDIRTVVSFYGAVRFTRRNEKDPMPDVMDVVREIKVPVQGHYGMLDKVAPVADAKEFEQRLKRQGTPIEMFYYEGAGHGFFDDSWQPEQNGAFGYNPAAAKLAYARMTKFLKRKLK